MKIRRVYKVSYGEIQHKVIAASDKWIEAVKRDKPTDFTKLLSEDWHEVDSSFIDAIAYDAATKLLSVRFKTGKKYVFEDVPKSVFKKFLNSSSKGSYFNSVIKKRY